MNQLKVNIRAAEHYNPLYKQHADDPEVKAACLKIVGEENARRVALQLDEVQWKRGIRTRIHELLQSRTEVPDPAIVPSTKAHELLPQLEEHHNEQTAHFQALWQHADLLAEEAIAKGGA